MVTSHLSEYIISSEMANINRQYGLSIVNTGFDNTRSLKINAVTTSDCNAIEPHGSRSFFFF